MKSIVSALLVFCIILTADAQVEDAYQQPPSYDLKSQLEDVWSIAQLVVVGRTTDGGLIVEGILFGGESLEFYGPEPLLSFGTSPGPFPGQYGVWFLVTAPGGYAVLNPNHKPVTPAMFWKLQPPTDHWTQQPDPSEPQSSYTEPNSTTPIRHGPKVYSYGTDGRMRVDLMLHGERQSWLLSEYGELKQIGKSPEKGGGFCLDYHKGHLVEFSYFKDRKLHGLSRRYSKTNPQQLREEKYFTEGVIDGRRRQWDEAGTLIADDVFDNGLMTPIVHYEGNDTSGVKIHRSKDGVTYSIENVLFGYSIQKGMTTQQVSDLLKVDFSPVQGLMFPNFHIDQYLFISFTDGKVSEIRRGHNGVCIDIAL